MRQHRQYILNNKDSNRNGLPNIANANDNDDHHKDETDD